MNLIGSPIVVYLLLLEIPSLIGFPFVFYSLIEHSHMWVALERENYV